MSYFFQRVNGTTESWRPPGDALPRRHTLTTTGNLRERFVKRPRQTSMYDRYGPWRGHDSAPQTGPFTGLADAQKKSCRVSPHCCCSPTVHRALSSFQG